MFKNLQVGLILAFSLILSNSVAYAAKCEYEGPTTITQSEWNNSSNWDCGHVPTASDDALLPKNQTYTIASNITTPATISSKGETSVAAGVSLNCGKIVAGRDFINNGTISFNGPTINYRISVQKNNTFTNNGTITVVSTTTAVGSTYIGGIRLANNAIFQNTGSLSIDVPSNETAIIVLTDAEYMDINGGTLHLISGTTDCTLGTCSFSLLPVVLAEIQAYEKGTANTIEWSTASEEDSHYFAVEYMEQGANTWRELERISAAGDSDYLIEYNFQHENPAEKAYYRLKMVDLDGSFEYSTVLSVHNQNAAASKFPVRLYPTLSTGTIYLERQNFERPINVVRIFDATGQMIKVSDLSNNMESLIKLPVSELKAGMYFLRVDNQSAQRFIISK